MNYYRRYVGDYMRDTGHLSLAEVGAYDRLLDHYYATEKPLPAEYEALYRLARAMTKAEQEAVRTVADQFFTITHDALRHNKRADQELTKAQPTIDAARTNGVKGGRPRKNPMGLSEEPNGVHPPTTNHQPPTTSLQPPSSNHTGKTLSGKPDVEQPESPKNGNDYRQQARDVLDYLNRSSGHTYRCVDANLDPIVARLKSGATALQIREVIFEKCRQWEKDENMMRYLRPATLFNRIKFEQYLGEIGGGSNG